ncbi:MAG: hypothetical protein OEY81_03840, partial [Candidatus Bathyarchaeota archaeon]|nr:hypothetical protein [Candidatus Bathyarchaeota archaeon]
ARFTTPVTASSGSPVVEWVKMISARSVIQTGDGGYALVRGSGDFCFEKLDSSGNVQWNRTFGGLNDDQANCVVETDDGGYAIVGSTNSFGAGGYDFWLVKTYANGTMLWNKTYGGTDSEIAYTVIQTSDRGYIMFGSYTVKTDYLGNEEWNRSYSGSSIVQTGDGGYAILGISQTTYPEARLTKINGYGNVEWDKTVDVPCYYYGSGGQGLIYTNDGAFTIAGTSGNYGPGGHSGFLLKTDSIGNETWHKQYPTSDMPYTSGGIQTADGGYALSGTSPWLLKTDNVGNEQWLMKSVGQPAPSDAGVVVQTGDGGYIVACSVWLVKLSPFPRHNLAIIQVTAQLSQVQEGDILPINVTILNDGNYNETANVTLYYDLIQIDSQTIVIQTDTSETLAFFWNTTGVGLGQHNILANATVTGETYLVDNVGQITVSIMGGSKISINTISSVSSGVGFYFNISGTLTDNRGNAISGGLVLLNYQWLGDVMWYEFASVQSKINGYYSAIWIPTARGNFTLKAKWSGNATYFGASNSTTVTVNPTHIVSISLSSSTSLIGFQVGINGTLASGGVGLSGTPMLLSYSVTDGESWNEITVVNTVSGGSYSAVWIPTATGYYLIRATWAHDPIVLRASAVVSLAVTPFREQNVFAVESNSTISALAFNSTAYELSFAASGSSGTTGYARVFISKELVANMSDLKVRVDETQIDFATASTDASWVLYFLYVHSTHHIIITIPAATDGGLGYNGNLMYVIIAIVVILIATIVYLRRRKRKKVICSLPFRIHIVETQKK